MKMIVWSFIFSLFLVVSNGNGTKNSLYKIHKKYNGFDNRYIDSPSPLQSYVISQFFEKKRLLDILENPQIPVQVKTRHLEQNGITPPNLKAGGLMKNWAFDMEEPPYHETNKMNGKNIT